MLADQGLEAQAGGTLCPLAKLLLQCLINCSGCISLLSLALSLPQQTAPKALLCHRRELCYDRTCLSFGEITCSEVAEEKCGVLKKIWELVLGNITLPQALNSTAEAHLPLVISIYRGIRIASPVMSDHYSNQKLLCSVWIELQLML